MDHFCSLLRVFFVGTPFFLLTSILEADHYRVYLIGGQSNGNGRGDAAELSVAPLDTLNLAAPQTDVRFYWHKTQSTSNGNLTQDTWIDLQPGSGHGVNSPSGHAVEFGSELTFGRAMADNDPSVNIAIIKYTHGGTNLHTQWAAGGTNYTSFVSTVEAGLQGLEDDGHSYEMGGMVWIQGESDTGAANAPNYEANLIDLMARVRNDVFGGISPGGYTLPFVISGLSDSQYPTIATATTSGAYIVRQAQETVAANERQAAFVNTDGLESYSNGTIHFTASAQIAIGNASAVQMLALESNDSDRDGLLSSEETALTTDSNLADSDGDGQFDGFEVAAGTDPASGASFFAICGIEVLNDEVTLQWPSLPGNLYGVEVSTDLLEWSAVASDFPAADPEILTTWSATLDSLTGSGPVLEPTPFVLYDGQTGGNGDFNTIAFDSVDTDPVSVAGRLFQGGSLTGGGANLFLLNRSQDAAYFDGHSDSGLPGFNFGGVNQVDQAAAAIAGDFFGFTVSANEEISYEALSFYSDQFGTNGKVDISYSIGSAAEVFVAQGLIPTGGNAPVTLESIDFPDFTTSEDVTWTFYLYASGGNNNGIRFDDIKLATSSTTSATTNVISNFTFTGPPWTAAKEADFATFAANTPSVDSDATSVTSDLSNSGYTGGGYNSFYIRDSDGFSIFSTSATSGVGMNLGDASAASPTNFISFEVSPVADPVTYGELSFYTGANGASDTYDIELRVWDGTTETILGLASHTSGSSNEAVAFKTIDFVDFSSAGAMEFRIYGYNVNSGGGIRFDDIVLTGPGETVTGGGSASSMFLRVRLQP
ncbi:MAG: sialate O-acetylesterase [Roseibacillus sp.]